MTAAHPRTATRADVQRLVAEGAQLVDVLPAAEYEEDRLPGAVNVPLEELGRIAPQRLARTRPVIVYCHDTI